jgi:CHRD domain
MHIHGLGVRGQAAGVFQNFTLTTSQKRKEGTYTGTLIIDNTSIKEADLLAGKYYLNLHSKVNTGGELRAQLEF